MPARRYAGRALVWCGLLLVTVVLLLTLPVLGLAELLVAGLRAAQRDRLGLTTNRLLRLHQRLKEAREKTVAAIGIAGEGA